MTGKRNHPLAAFALEDDFRTGSSHWLYFDFGIWQEMIRGDSLGVLPTAPALSPFDTPLFPGKFNNIFPVPPSPACQTLHGMLAESGRCWKTRLLPVLSFQKGHSFLLCGAVHSCAETRWLNLMKQRKPEMQSSLRYRKPIISVALPCSKKQVALACWTSSALAGSQALHQRRRVCCVSQEEILDPRPANCFLNLPGLPLSISLSHV